jgi:hypothetical protein
MPDMSDEAKARVGDELTAALHRLVEDTNAMWRDGTIAADSSVRDVCDDLDAVQHAPHRDPAPWRATSGAAWVEGTEQAAKALHGQGCRWSLRDLVVLPRHEAECVASYRVVHEWGDERRPPAQALFLETWRRSPDGRWRLARHTAEKV